VPDGSSEGPLIVFVGTDAKATRLAARAWIDTWLSQNPDGTVVTASAPAEWPFRHPLVPPLASGPLVVHASDLHEAFVNRQTASTRLVTTQAIFLCESWAEALRAHGLATLVATADLESLREHAPEVLARRGLFAKARVEMLTEIGLEPAEPVKPAAPAEPGFRHAFRVADAAERLRLCIKALNGARTAGALVATASVCMEVNDLDAAARNLDEALALAPEWAAAHFERGKLWLRLDDMTRASESFRAAARALPRFGSAWANLGGTLGELDRPTEALEAFEHALACDPTSHQALNNLGVVRRELGRLTESEATFRQVIQLAPELAFGYYNLGHTLFLQGRYQAALSAYAEGQGRDPEKNPVQATRLALCKIATGDSQAALRDLQQATAALPKEYRRQVLADTSAVLWALVTQKPDLRGWQPVQAWMSGELGKL
jgi:tetratricopeptide (TPR) repeat protein